MSIFDRFQKGKDKNNHKKIPRTVQESIPYTTVYKDGMIETVPDSYTRMYKFEDVNFKIASDTEKNAIFNTYKDLLNSFPAGTSFQVLIRRVTALTDTGRRSTDIFWRASRRERKTSHRTSILLSAFRTNI